MKKPADTLMSMFVGIVFLCQIDNCVVCGLVEGGH